MKTGILLLIFFCLCGQAEAQQAPSSVEQAMGEQILADRNTSAQAEVQLRLQINDLRIQLKAAQAAAKCEAPKTQAPKPATH